eukprot:TRINITY_DN3431_c0_g1_i2.p1 TRINITY_DN3431_c0_g1~~TRINITY_DN3431_c0_g1_i2.p1  ORF type:complete len:379 (-),score=136.03 TRINITY_DN3431_c0_g1_i2:151-1287(-)
MRLKDPSFDGIVTKTLRTVLFSTFSLPVVADPDDSSVQRPILMFKPESHGTRGWSDTMAHGIDYIATRPVIAKNFGNVEGKVERKERVPDWAIRLLAEACAGLGGAVSERAQKTSAGIGVSHMIWLLASHSEHDPHGDLAAEMQLQVAAALQEQNTHWWTQHPDSRAFYAEQHHSTLLELIDQEEGFRYRLGNEVFIGAALSLCIERALRVVLRTRLAGNWQVVSEAFAELAAPLDEYHCNGVVMEALVRVFLPQERRLRLCFEEFLGQAIEESLMQLCTGYLHAIFVQGEIASNKLESLLLSSLEAITNVERLEQAESSNWRLELKSKLQHLCTNSREHPDGSKLVCIRQATYVALAHLMRTHFEDFLKSSWVEEHM